MNIIIVLIVTVIEAALFFFLVPRFIEQTTVNQAPDITISLVHSGIANFFGFIGGLFLGGRWLLTVYFVYAFWHPFNLRLFGVFVCSVVMFSCDYALCMLLISMFK